MGTRSKRRPRVLPVSGSRTLASLLGVVTLLGILVSLAAPASGIVAAHGAGVSFTSAQNGSSGSDPPGSSSSIVCPSTGPVILGVEWDCVAVLNLTELVLILGSIGIIAYVFKDSDQAELPGDSAEVPVTAEEWEAYRAARRQGVSRWPPEPPNRKEDP